MWHVPLLPLGTKFLCVSTLVLSPHLVYVGMCDLTPILETRPQTNCFLGQWKFCKTPSQGDFCVEAQAANCFCLGTSTVWSDHMLHLCWEPSAIIYSGSCCQNNVANQTFHTLGKTQLFFLSAAARHTLPLSRSCCHHHHPFRTRPIKGLLLALGIKLSFWDRCARESTVLPIAQPSWIQPCNIHSTKI